MSNREQYKKAFSVLQTSSDFTLEDEKMAILKKKAMLNSVTLVTIISTAKRERAEFQMQMQIFLS